MRVFDIDNSSDKIMVIDRDCISIICSGYIDGRQTYERDFVQLKSFEDMAEYIGSKGYLIGIEIIDKSFLEGIVGDNVNKFGSELYLNFIKYVRGE